MKTHFAPFPVLPQDAAPETGLPGPQLSPLTMSCLLSWATARAARGRGSPSPEVPGAQSLELPEPNGSEVGTGVWDQAAFPGSPEWVTGWP